MRSSNKLTLALTVVFVFFSCTKGTVTSEQKKETAAGQETQGGNGGARRRDRGGPVPVKLAKAEKKRVPRLLETVVTLQGRRQADVYSKVLGRVRSISVKEGDAVRAGQHIADIDRNDPGESFLSVPLQSPINGWIGRLIATVGTQVTPQDPILTVVDDVSLRAEVFLPVSDWTQVTAATKVTAILGDEEKIGRVVTVARAADAATGRGSFVAEFPNPDRKWKAGTVVKLRSEINPKDRIILSTTALSVTDAGSFIFVADAGSAKRVPVEYELITNDTFEVLKGLNGGEDVVVEGTGRLSPGAKLKPVEDTEDTQ